MNKTDQLIKFSKYINYKFFNKYSSSEELASVYIKKYINYAVYNAVAKETGLDELNAAIHLLDKEKYKELHDSINACALETEKAINNIKLLKNSEKKHKLNKLLDKYGANEWWRLSDQEEQGQLDKEYDFGKGLKFKAKDIPELATQIEVPAGPVEHHPEKNQLMHTNLVYDRAKKISEDPMVWFAALLHDLGKSHTDKAIWPKQYGHEEGGVPYVEQVSNLLGVPEDWKDFAMQVARHHLNCHRAAELSPKTLKISPACSLT